MQKEFHKLILVFIMVTASMFLGFFLGRDITLREQRHNQPPPPSSPQVPLPQKTQLSPLSANSIITPPEKKAIPASQPSLPPSSSPSPPEKDLPPPKALSPSSPPAVTPPPSSSVVQPLFLYGLFISSHENKEKAMEHSTQLKIRFPKWRFFFKKSGKQYRVYIGPFREKNSAQNFLEEIKNTSEFPSPVLEKIVFKRSQSSK